MPEYEVTAAARHLHDMLWGKNNFLVHGRCVSTDSSLHYIPAKVIQTMRLHTLGFREDVFLLREEYIDAYQTIGVWRHETGIGGVAIIGQPGIGK